MTGIIGVGIDGRTIRGHRLQVYNWQRIIDDYGPSVWQTAYRLLRNNADAADCFQETLVAAFELSRRQPVRNMQGLLIRLATTRAIDRLRQRNRHSQHRGAPRCDEPASPCVGPLGQAQENELAARLRTAICQLPRTEAKAFCLRHFSDMSYRQIAKELGIKTSAAGVLLHRAKAKLRELLEVAQPEDNEVVP